ncbi:MAG TPA: TerB family tellurite resistance protein [Nordella sp.]|nr:TerB family tellurite resistance protein [Nordella sp.]
MRIHPCVVVGLDPDTARCLREGDRLTLVRGPEAESPVSCFHGSEPIGHIPPRRGWVALSLADGDSPEVTVTGFDTEPGGKLAHIEIAVAIMGDAWPEPPAIRSLISEIGDELRILALVGAADGQLAPVERGVMEQFAATRAAELGLDPDEGEVAHAVRWAHRNLPNVLDVAAIAKQLSKERPEALPVIWEACTVVAEIDGRIAPEERQFMTTLRALLGPGKREDAGG